MVNLVHVADERGAAKVDPASTHRRLQRLFQPEHLPADWAAPMNAGFAGGAEKRTLVLDRTNRKIGETEVTIAVITSLFGKAKTRGLNFEDTRLTDPARLHLLTAIAALAIASAVRAARTKTRPDGTTTQNPRIPRQVLQDRLHLHPKQVASKRDHRNPGVAQTQNHTPNTESRVV